MSIEPRVTEIVGDAFNDEQKAFMRHLREFLTAAKAEAEAIGLYLVMHIGGSLDREQSMAQSRMWRTMLSFIDATENEVRDKLMEEYGMIREMVEGDL